MNTHFSKAASAYRNVGLQTQAPTNDQYQLVVMMFEATLEAVARAKGAILDKDVLGKVDHIGKAVRIVQEGLRTSLDLENGGELAANLANLYDYCVMRLTQANATGSVEALDEVAALLKPVAEAWRQLRSGPEAQDTAPAKANATEPPATPKAPPVARRVGQLYGQGMALTGV